ncbi:FecR family protein [Prolixibacter sp. NT017]|uniref:FecR family protein n=1 Tax=Prolixibacter sp. NT017 TaxID=2652390 RepID=UPI00127F7F9B|nr:FecR family protein [Prolixibacter sp. NT017]GET25631.1 iron dicitrate transporter FecR [Prolixibacter sp. NT017]
MKNRKHRLDELIENYLNDKLTPKDKNLLDQFTKNVLKKADWDKETMGNKADIASGIWGSLTWQLHRRQLKTIRRQQARWSISIAASIILIVGLGVWLYHPGPKPEVFTVETNSKMDSLKLPDGSVIFLSPHTTIAYNNRFNVKKRKVKMLKGNAFFRVVHNVKKPFEIISGNLKTTDLGTSFNIHMGRNSCQVTVHTGKVNVSTGKSSVNLIAMQEACYSADGEKLIVKNVGAADISPWYSGNTTLADQSLETILSFLEKKFGLVAIRVNPHSLKMRATVYIPGEAKLEPILQQINYITNLKLEIHGKIISSEE